MANTVIQIKRSASNSAPLLQPGELGYTSNGEILFIGSSTGTDTANVVPIAGKRTPGTLTANQALVANSSSWINNVQTAKLIIGAVGTTANITALTTDGTLTGANVSNSTIASTWAIKDYVDNNSAADLAGLNDVDLTGIANNEYLVYDATAAKWEPHTISGTTDEIQVSFSNNDLTIGLPDNVTITSNLNVTVNLQTNTANITATTVSSNTTTGALTVAGGVGINGKLNVTDAAIGNTTNYTSINATSVSTNNIFATSTVNASILSVGGWVIANNSGVFTSGVVNGDILQVGSNFRANTTQVNVAVLMVTGNINTTGTINATAGFNAGANINISTSGINVGNSSVNSSITATAVDLDGTLSAGNTTISGFANVNGTLAAGNTSITGTLSAGNTTITGNLTVTGTLTTIDTTNLIVEDSLIRLARNQANTGTFTDAVDIGFYGVYGNTTNTIYTGLARESGTSNYVLFANNTVAPDNDGVEITDTLATLYARLNSGALVSNSSTVAITANSTVNVAITANTLSLTTALGVSSGGTGLGTLTANAVMVGNGTGPITMVSSSTEGHVLQITSGAPVFGHLDGGTF